MTVVWYLQFLSRQNKTAIHKQILDKITPPHPAVNIAPFILYKMSLTKSSSEQVLLLKRLVKKKKFNQYLATQYLTDAFKYTYDNSLTTRWLDIVKYLVKHKHHKLATLILEKYILPKSRNPAIVLAAAATIANLGKNYAQALALYNKAQKAKPSDLRIRSKRIILLHKLNQDDLALKNLEYFTTKRLLSQLAIVKAEILFKRKQFKKAITYFIER